MQLKKKKDQYAQTFDNFLKTNAMFRMKTPPFVGSNNIFCIMKIDTLNF